MQKKHCSTGNDCTCLGPKVCGGADILMLGFRCAPGVVEFEAFVTVASLAVHAALGSLLLLRRLTDVTHDGNGCTGRLTVALHYALQSKVAKQHTDSTFTKVDIMLAAGACDRGDTWGHRSSAPARGWDGAWGRSEGEKQEWEKKKV